MNMAWADSIIAAATGLYVGRKIVLVKGGESRFSGPVIYAANHPTTLDPLILARAAGCSYSALITESAFKVPIVGSILRGGRNIPVSKRGAGGEALIDEAATLLSAGRSLAVFPEGCLNPEASPARLRSGTVRIAATSGAPVVPVGIAVSGSGTRVIETTIDGRVEKGRYLFRGWYVVRFGAPLDFAVDPEDHAAVNAGTSRLAEALARLMDEANDALRILETEALGSPGPLPMTARLAITN